MAGSARKKKIIHYKHFTAVNSASTLQVYFDEALRQRDKPQSRQELLDKEGSTRRLINSVKRQDAMLFGQMLRYEAGRDQTVIVIDEDSEEFPIESLRLPARRDGKVREVLESVLYFGVLENHVLLLQSAALRAKHFEHHLNWLLLHHAGTMPRDMAVVLSDRPTEKARRAIRRTPPKKIVIGAPIGSQVQGEGSMPMKNERVSKTLYLPAGRGADILAAAMGHDWFSQLKFSDSLDGANLRVQLEISYLRKTTATGERVLEDIANACRNFDEEDTAIHLKGGGIIQGDELKLRGEIVVDTYGGVVDSQDLYARMAAWLKERIEQGKVK